jgi:hypothetical protein
VAKAIMMVYSDPVEPTRDQEYREWYDFHIAEALRAVPGMPRAVRYRLSTEQRHPVDVPFGYVTIYEIDADDIDAVHTRLSEAWDRDELPRSDVIRPGPIIYWDVDREIT